MREAFDLFIVEGETPVAIEQAIHTRQHFPSLEIVALTEDEADASGRQDASNQNVELVPTDCSDRRLRDRLRAPVAAFERTSGPAAERIDPCRSLVGNLNQFSAAEILLPEPAQRAVCLQIGPRQQRDFPPSRDGAARDLRLDRRRGGGGENFRWRQGNSIRGVRELSGDETRRLESDWNAVFTTVGVVQGQLKARRRELLGRSAFVQALSSIFGRRMAVR